MAFLALISSNRGSLLNWQRNLVTSGPASLLPGLFERGGDGEGHVQALRVVQARVAEALIICGEAGRLQAGRTADAFGHIVPCCAERLAFRRASTVLGNLPVSSRCTPPRRLPFSAWIRNTSSISPITFSIFLNLIPSAVLSVLPWHGSLTHNLQQTH